MYLDELASLLAEQLAAMATGAVPTVTTAWHEVMRRCEVLFDDTLREGDRS